MELRIFVALLALFVPWCAQANMLVIDVQGVSPNRANYYVQDYATDQTILTGDPFGEVAIQQIEMVVVYEAPDKPYWSNLELEFKCPNKRAGASAAAVSRKKKPEFSLPDPESVEVRLVRGFQRFKGKHEIVDMQPGNWQQTTAYPMLRAWRVACDDDAVARAKAAATKNNMLKQVEFGKHMDAIGLGNVVILDDENSSWLRLADMTWDKLWTDAKKPVFPKARPMTPQEKADLDRRLAAMESKLKMHKAQVMGDIEQMQAGFAMTEAAAKLRGNRKISNTERSLLYVWEGKKEQDVVASMGPPAVNEAAGIRFLSYGMEYDNRVQVTQVMTGASWVQGVYKSCNVSFVLIPDGSQTWRVGDVRVSTFRDGSGAGPDVCANLLHVPNR